MQKGSTIFLKTVIGAVGLFVLFLCVYGLPVTISAFSWGGYDPLLVGMYVPAIPFYIALGCGLRLLGHIDRDEVFSQPAVNSLRTIQWCGVAISGMYAAGMPYIFYVADKDDAPGVVAIALVIIFSSFVISVAAALFKQLLQRAVDLKVENDLTV